MSKAIFAATYADWRLVKTRSVVQLIFEIPIEKSNEALQALGGMPNFGEDQWFAIARLVSQPATEGHDNIMRPAPSEPSARAHMVTRAAMCCIEPRFWKFLDETFSGKPPNMDVTDEASAATVVRYHCRVKSRSEILPATPAGDRWDRLYSRYVAWRDEDVFVEAS
jgi:hypothetical protein